MDTIILTLGAYDVSAGWAIALAIGAVFFAFIALLIVLLGNNRAQIEAASELEKARLAPQIEEKNQLIDKQEKELAHMRQFHTSLEAQNTGLKVRLQEQAKQNAYVQEQMQGQFKLLAEDVLTSQSEKFSKQNREQVDNLLKPLREKIGEFQKQSHEGAAQLAEQMKTLTRDSLRMSEEATNLTRALKGSSQVQGAWGEMILSNILEKSGLVEGEQFLTQQSHQGEGGTRVRTDVEVMFPNGDKMVIDSKVSLVAFEAYCNCDDEEARISHLREHIVSIKGHIKTLGEKDYQVHSRSGFDFVMMFIPIEAAFSAAFEADSSLIDFAMAKNVYITTPTTLMVALRTVRNVWDIETRNQNAEIIAERAGHLYYKVSGFLA
ncbi:MAG: DNA recombination protein RmuC, partial [Devosiaceae bacterium]|nr:DNA recombination protein RmuC [Devosiaceae bacterium]